MIEPCAFDLRRLTMSDVGAAMRLKNEARWNQTADDWRRMLRLAPANCFGLWADEQLVATTTMMKYHSDLAWIGMVLVDKEYRRRGLATRLMRAALDEAQTQGVATVKLDATPDGRAIYENLGFEIESLIERWEAVITRAPSSSAGTDLQRATATQIRSLDLSAFGADRTELLAALFDDACATPLMHPGANGRPDGYALARRGSAATYIGPLIAADAQIAAALLDEMCSGLTNQRVYLDFNTTFHAGAQLLSERGFRRQRELLRMRSGAASAAATSPIMFAIAGPELG